MPPPYFSGFDHNGVSWGFREAAEDAALGGRWDADWTISRDGVFIGLAKLGDSNELLLTFPGTEQPSHDELTAVAKHLGADGYEAPLLGGRRIPFPNGGRLPCHSKDCEACGKEAAARPGVAT